MLRLHVPDRPTDQIPPDVIASGVQTPLSIVPDAEAIRSAVWIDLAFPLPHERRAVEEALGIALPSKADMVSIEASSRVYREGSAQVMNVLLVVGVDSDEPAAVPVSLILTPRQLVTVRYADPTAFRMLDLSCTRTAPGPSPHMLVVRLLDAVVDKTADILERMGGEIDKLSASIFGRDRPNTMRISTDDLTIILRRIGNTQFVLNKVHDSLVTLARATSFLQLGHEEADAGVGQRQKPDRVVRDSIKSVNRDLMSLSENTAYLTQNIAFLLDAALGRISIEQNAIIKIFSVGAVVFLPPTLVASIYGMNFEVMPELEWPLGYPFALLLMVLAAVLPYLWFKRRGWL
ncbi:MAG: magnesium transporter CorA family protein [Sphingomonadaceae bacterium]